MIKHDIGWWASLVKGANDPYGRTIHIDSQHERFVAKGYNARHLAAGAPGVPLFEIFVTKDSDQKYKEQVVYFTSTCSRMDNLHMLPFQYHLKLLKTQILTQKNYDVDVEDEGLRWVLKYLKAGMSSLKFKVLKVVTIE